ncbi:MAG: MarR family winged helix-turn-helix transcriptional regulator [Gammaproteobacteria bacterium]
MNTRAVRLEQHRSLWSRYSSNLPRHLIAVSQHLQAETMRLLGERGFAGLRLSFEPYISLVGDEGARLTELAEALGISKQACGQAADEIERAGYLARASDPADGRARRLVLTARGRALQREGFAVISRVQVDHARLLGEARLLRLVRLLERLDIALPEAAGPRLPPGAPGTELGTLLPRLARHVVRELMDLTRAHGHPGLKLSFAQVLGLIGPTGGRMQQMARAQQVSKQAIGAIARELEGLGYLARGADPADARQVVLALTPQGVRLLEDSIAAVDALGASFAARIGTRNLAELSNLMASLYEGLGLEPELRAPGAELLQLARELRQQLGEQGALALARLLQQTPEDAPA